MHGYGYILGHLDHSAFTAQVLLAVFSWLFLSGKMYVLIIFLRLILGPILSQILGPILGPVQGLAHVLYCAVLSSLT